MKTRQKVRRAVTVASVVLFPVTLYYFSPVLSLQALASGIAAGSLVMFGMLFLSSLFLGRSFCAWACPAGAVQEVVRGFGGRAVRRRSIRWIKWLIWSPWVLALVFMAIRAGGVHSVDVGYMTWHGISVKDLPGLIALVSVSGLVAVLALAVGRRAACHTVCWMAPFMILGGKLRGLFGWPSLGLAADPRACQSCGSCTKSCPMSIDVDARVKAGDLRSSDCILCASCVDACPRAAIRFTFGPGPGPRLAPQQKSAEGGRSGH